MIQKKLSDKKKIKVLEELQAGVFDIPSASKKYKISKQSLYTWLKIAGIPIPPSQKTHKNEKLFAKNFPSSAEFNETL